jgi:hypothetical protein
MRAPGWAAVVGARCFRYGALKEAFSVWHERAMRFECAVVTIRVVEAWFGRKNGAAKTDLDE